MFNILILLAVVAVLTWLAITDLRSRRLPVGGAIAIAMLFIMHVIVDRMPIHQVMQHLVVALVVFLICVALFAANMLGGGDAKLAAAIFLWTGAATLLLALTLISVIGTLVSFVSLLTWNMNRASPGHLKRVLAMFSGARGVPYGVALAAGGGAAIVLPSLLPLLLRL
jgi:prepilin peptidase CpaA